MPVNAELLASIGQNMPSPMEGVQKAYQLKDLMNREQASSLGLENAKSGAAQDAAIKSLAEKADLTTTEGQMDLAANVAKVSPQKGMEFMRAVQELQQGKGALEKQKYELLAEQNDIIGQAAAGLSTEYDSLIQRGVPAAQAAGMMQPKYLQTIQQLAGTKLGDGTPALSQQHKDMLAQNAMFNPDQVRSWAMQSNQAREALRVQLAFHSAERADAQFGEQQRHNRVVEDAAAAKAAAAEEGLLDDDTAANMAAQYLAGDTSVLTNLGRGAQGAKNIIKVRKAIYSQGDELGMDPNQIATKVAEYRGLMAGERELGTRVAKIEMAVNEAYNMIDIAADASAQMPRGSFVPLNKAQQMYEQQTGGPEIARFVAANNSLVNAFSRAVSPSGVPTVSDKDHAREMLNTAMSPQAYQAVLEQMKLEMEAARKSPGQVKQTFRDLAADKEHGAETPKGGAPAVQRARNPKTGEVVELRDGKWVKVGG